MNLQTEYNEEIRPALAKELGIGLMAVPKIQKVVIDMGVGEGARNKELINQLASDISLISGQKAQIRPSKRAVSGFGIRVGDPVGIKVTLRGSRMYAFLEKLVRIILPRVRDFRGVSLAAFDGRGNYTLGLVDHTIFPEIDIGKAGRSWGMSITIVTSAKNDEQAKRLLEEFGMPFEKSSISSESRSGSIGGQSSK